MACPFRCAGFVLMALALMSAVASADIYTVHLEPEDGFYDFDLRQPAFSLRKVYFTLSGQTGEFSVRVETIESDDEWVYQYLFINGSGMAAEPGSVIFDFEVDRQWIEGLNVDVGTIGISSYTEEKGWVPVGFSPVSEDSDSLNYRAWPLSLSGLFAVTGEPVPVVIDINSPCNGNDVCEPGRGEDRENCPDCVSLEASACVPSERRCMDDGSLLICEADGSGYDIQACPLGCSGGSCISVTGAITGAAAGLNPVFLSVIAALVMVLAYLTMLVHRARKQLKAIEEKRTSHDEVKKLVKRS